MYKPEPIYLHPHWRLAGRRAYRVLKTIFINVLVAVTILLVIEIGVRIFHPEITPMGTNRNLFAPRVYQNSIAPKPNAIGMSCGVEFRVDQQGFWKYSAAFDSTKPSWLLLGDSVTMGMGVDPDSTFAGRLAAAADSFNILNAAVIGYASTDYRHVAEGLLQDVPANGKSALHIQHVALFWCLNDVYANVGDFGAPGQTVRQISGGLLKFLKLHFYTYQWLKTLLLDRGRDYYLHDRSFYAEAGPHVQAAMQDLHHIHALAQKNNLRFEVVLLPYQYQLRAGASDRLPQSVMQKNLESMGIAVYEVTDFLRTVRNETAALYRYGDGIHFSPAGHAVLAKYLQLQFAAVTRHE